MPRYWQSRVWSTFGEFRRETGCPRRVRPADSARTLVHLAAYLGSTATDTAMALNITRSRVRGVAKGLVLPTPVEMERLHDWVSCSLWRHLWRGGSPDHATFDAVDEARRHAFGLADLPPDWTRDWLIALREVRNV